MTYTVSATDDAGTPLNDTETITVTITGTNDGPQATNLNAAENYTEDTPLNLVDIVISDVDDSDLTVTLTLSDVAAGALNTGTSGAVTSTFANGVWTASGAIADVNNLLAALTFTPASDYDSDFTIATSVDDGEAPAVTGVKNFTATAVNDAPVITGGPDTSSLIETNSGLTDSGTLTVSDVDETDTVTASVDSVVVTGTGSTSLPAQLDNAALQDFLSVSPTEVLDSTQTTNTLTWNFSSGTEAFNFLAEGETLILTYTVSATDDAGTPLSDTETVTVTITGTNDAPAIAQLSDDAVAAYDFEDGTDSIASGGPVISVSSPVTISDTAGFTTGSSGLLFPTGDVDSTTNPVSIGTIPGVATSNEFSFTAQVRFDAGDGDRNFERIFDFGGGEDNNNLILTRNQSSNDLLLEIRRGSTITGNLIIAGALDGIEGEFHQYGVTLDATGLAKVFIDGIEVGSIDVGVSGTPNYSTWDENYIGSSNFPNNNNNNKQFQGAIDDIGIFDRALTSSEMASLANTSTPQDFNVDENAAGHDQRRHRSRWRCRWRYPYLFDPVARARGCLCDRLSNR